MLRRGSALVAVIALLGSFGSRVYAQRTVDDWDGRSAGSPAPATEILTAASAQEHETRFEPAVAGGLSAVLPGAGQFYNGQKAKGIVMLAGFATSIVFAAAAGFGDGCAYCAAPFCVDGHHPSCEEQTGPNSGFWIGLAGAAGFYGWSILDAISVATRSSRPAEGGERGADLELAPRLQNGAPAVAAGMRLKW